MKNLRQPASASGSYIHSASVPTARPVTDYAALVIPHCDGVAIPQEDARFLWQR